ncbi:alpha-(1,3)-fucosyltransferase fut-1-like [Aplysia californica]|uniref:Fucosyltransferase n=1 Tax=Aplysia californica TaxID=6500 RepID=A0ABM0JC45_APLCA|nr:alpha-(1,3)-fucosyltransferase fut-1-like [Aplysia californica]
MANQLRAFTRGKPEVSWQQAWTSPWQQRGVFTSQPWGQFVEEPPPARRPEQIFVYYQIEPPTLHRHVFPRYRLNTSQWLGVFNWTMSYRMDSDIQSYYALLRRRPVPHHKNYTEIVASKSKMAVWMVSHKGAQSKRDEYVRELQKYIPVDIFGGSSPLKCPRKLDAKCNQILSRDYTFYLGFENSFCDNYITEKFYKYLNLDTVLVARGIGEYSNIAPSEIFINTADYKSPKELAKRLIHLDSHDQEYIQILAEKDKYFTIYEDYLLTGIKPPYLENRYEAVSICQMCQRLWNLDRFAKSVPDISAWYKQSKCYKPRDI